MIIAGSGSRPTASSNSRALAHGILLATLTTGENRNDVTQLIPLSEAIPPIRGQRDYACRAG